MSPALLPMSPLYSIPAHWKRWARAQGFSEAEVETICAQFKGYYSVNNGKYSDLAWERRFHRWVEKLKPAAPEKVAATPAPEEAKPVTKFIGLQYLAQMRMILDSSMKAKHMNR